MAGTFVDGLVFSCFDEKAGPVTVGTAPEHVELRIARGATDKAMSMLSGSEKHVPRDVEIVSVPGSGSKMLVKFLQLEDKDARAGVVNATLSVVFMEEHDVVFYKYFSRFNDLLDGAAVMVQRARAGPPLQAALNAILLEILDTLDELRDAELDEVPPPPATTPAFPDEDASSRPAKVYRAKIIVCGDPQVGKSSSILRFTDNAFRRAYVMTIGVNLSVKAVQAGEGVVVEFTVWDVAGQAKFQLMRKRYYENARGFLLVCDKTRKETVDTLPAWCKDIRSHLGDGIPGIILANKSDLADRARVTSDEIAAVASQLDLPWMETSAKDGTNVTQAFTRLARVVAKLG